MKSMRKGFTLVELMVVIVIIGILAALAIPRFLGASNKAKVTEFKPVLKQMSTLEEAYRQERDVYTSDKASIGFDAPGGGTSRFTYTIAGATTDIFTLNATLATNIGTLVAGAQTVTWTHTATITDPALQDKKDGTDELRTLANWQ